MGLGPGLGSEINWKLGGQLCPPVHRHPSIWRSGVLTRPRVPHGRRSCDCRVDALPRILCDDKDPTLFTSRATTPKKHWSAASQFWAKMDDEQSFLDKALDGYDKVVECMEQIQDASQQRRQRRGLTRSADSTGTRPTVVVAPPSKSAALQNVE